MIRLDIPKTEMTRAELIERAKNDESLTEHERKYQITFWTEMVEIEGGCWIPIQQTAGNGYKQCRKKAWHWNRQSHIIAWEVLHGETKPEGRVMDHICQVKTCSNPFHVEPVTQQVNAQRGRNSKLTESIVLWIRETYASGTHTKDQLAQITGVTVETVGDVLRGKTWTNVGGPISRLGKGNHEKHQSFSSAD